MTEMDRRPPRAGLLQRCPVVPVVVLDDPDDALALGQALLAGGIDVVEITLRTAAGLPAIRRLADLPGLLVGAGSVLTARQVDQVADAGAGFVVSPGTGPAVLDRAAERGLPALPGISGGSDLMVAAEHGLREVKVFPADLLGGPAAVRALSQPFPGMTFLPSGGVRAETMGTYLSLPMVPAVSGSWMVAADLLRRRDWQTVTARASEALELARPYC